MTIEKVVGIVILIIGAILFTETIVFYFTRNGVFFIILIPSTFKTWKYFWEK